MPKKFMYINGTNDGSVLINIDNIVYILREAHTIKMLDNSMFVVKQSELDEILTELERR